MANQPPPPGVFPAAPPLVGREREQAALREALDAAIAGRGSLVLIGGEAGIGKTALAEATLAEAQAQGALAQVGRCYDLAETPPYGPWIEALARLPAAEQCPLPAPLGAGAPAPSQAALAAATRAALAAVAAQRPLVALLDDLHWADPASLDLLRAVARGLADLPLLVLATYRTDEVDPDHPLYAALPALVREARALRLALRPLDLRQVAALVAARYPLPEADAARLVAYLDRRAEGNPFFVGELLHALEESGLLRPPGEGERSWELGDLDRARLPSLVRQVIDGRAARLGGAARDLLAVAAAIGQEVRPDLWATVAEAHEGALLPVAEAALAARLLAETPDGQGVRFAHALVREALYAGIPPLRRRALHRRIGEALLAGPHPDPDAVAAHLQSAGDPRAADWLIQAGDRARRAWAWQSAAARYAAALDLRDESDDPVERGWLLYRLAKVRQYADAGRALPAIEEAVRLADGAANRALRAYALGVRGFMRFAAGDLRAGVADLEAGARGIAALPDDERERIGARLAPLAGAGGQTLALLLAWVGRYAEARRLAEPLLLQPPARSLDSYAAMRDVHAALGEVEATRRLVARSLDAIHLQAGNPFVTGYSPFCDLIMVALPYAADDLGWRERLALRSEAGFVRAGAMVSEQAARVARLPLLALEGHWREARELGLALRAVREVGEAWWDRVTIPVLATIAHAQGEPATAWALVRECHSDGPATEPGGAYFYAALALQRLAAALALAAGDLPAARDWLAAHDRWLAWSGAVLGQADGALAWAAYHSVAGDPALARRHADQAVALAAAPRQPLTLLAAHRLLGEHAVAAGHHADAAAHLDAALTLAEACAAPYERALTLLTLAELHLATGSHTAARAALDEARAILAPLEARPAIGRADALAARLPGPDSPGTLLPAGLTAREAEVLRLVAQGLTNAEVAARLFLSTRTIEQHLRSIYTKLDVSSRTAAAHFAVEHRLL